MLLRKCLVTCYEYKLTDKGVMGNVKVEKPGLFHQWGIDVIEESPNHDGVIILTTRTVAIVEMEDGTIATPYPSYMRFVYE